MRSSVCLIIVLLLAGSASAHVDGGYDVAKGDLLIDLGWEPAELTAGTESEFVISLLNISARDVIVPDTIDIRISRGDNVVFSESLAPTGQNLIFSYPFKEAGSHEMHATFLKDSRELISHTFNLEVDGDEELARYSGGKMIFIIEIALAAAVLLGFLSYLVIRKKGWFETFK